MENTAMRLDAANTGAAARAVSSDPDVIELLLPAREDLLLIVRLTVSGAVARFTGDFDALEDLKTAASEACYCLIQQCCAFARLRLRIWCDGRIVRIAADGDSPTAAPSEIRDRYADIAGGILSTMVDETAVHFDCGCVSGFTLQKRVD